MKSGSSTIAEYSYDEVGNRKQQAYGEGTSDRTSTEYAFDNDPRYRITSITHECRLNDVIVVGLAQIDYPSRDDVGNLLEMTDWTGTWSYEYDSNNRLVGATPPNPVPGQPAGGPYGYDWVGNRLNPPADPNPMVYNDGDQLVRWPGMYWYSYDDAGNLVQVKNGYYTHWMEPDFGLLQLGVRFYDAEVGRFTQRDPIGYVGGLNLYEYVRGNPVTGLDPSGMFCIHWTSFKSCMKGAILNAIRGCLSTSYGPCFACVGAVLIGCIPSSGAYGGCVGVGLHLCGFTCGWSTTRCIIGAVGGIAVQAIGCAAMTRVPCHCEGAIGWGE